MKQAEIWINFDNSCQEFLLEKMAFDYPGLGSIHYSGYFRWGYKFTYISLGLWHEFLEFSNKSAYLSRIFAYTAEFLLVEIRGNRLAEKNRWYNITNVGWARFTRCNNIKVIRWENFFLNNALVVTFIHIRDSFNQGVWCDSNNSEWREFYALELLQPGDFRWVLADF